MRSPSFRRAARLFAAVLLLWTAADLLGHGLCVHDHEPIGVFAEPGYRSPSSDESTGHVLFDDCFCCSHVVDVKHPFHLGLLFDIAWTFAEDTLASPRPAAASLYHPPLA